MKWHIDQRDDQVPHGRGYLVLTECPRGECRFSLRRAAGEADGTKWWGWDGNVKDPTITPSVNCNGGCHRHFVMTAGTPSPDTP